MTGARARATASDALWQDHLFHQRAAGAGRDERALDARDDYRMRVLGRITFGGADNASASLDAVQ